MEELPRTCLLPAIEVADNALCIDECWRSGKWRNSTNLESLEMIVTEFESSCLTAKWLFWNFYSDSFLSANGCMIKVACTYICICECSRTENKECDDENVVVKNDREDEFLVCCH